MNSSNQDLMNQESKQYQVLTAQGVEEYQWGIVDWQYEPGDFISTATCSQGHISQNICSMSSGFDYCTECDGTIEVLGAKPTYRNAAEEQAARSSRLDAIAQRRTWMSEEREMSE